MLVDAKEGTARKPSERKEIERLIKPQQHCGSHAQVVNVSQVGIISLSLVEQHSCKQRSQRRQNTKQIEALAFNRAPQFHRSAASSALPISFSPPTMCLRYLFSVLSCLLRVLLLLLELLKPHDARCENFRESQIWPLTRVCVLPSFLCLSCLPFLHYARCPIQRVPPFLVGTCFEVALSV